MTTDKTAADVATQFSPPMTTAFINLSDYMYQAYDTPYASTPLAAAIGFTPLLRRNGTPVVSVDDSTGLYGEAFVSTGPGPKQVIVAYEGTKLPAIPGSFLPNLFAQGQTFSAAQITDDLQIYGGQKAQSFAGSAQFARQVIAIARHQDVRKSNIYLTGHSLGAAEAEFAAAKTGLSGVTFAGPGINTAYTGRRPGNVTDYVDAGDPIGNYAADGLNTLAPVLTSDNIKHYGNTVILPNSSGLSSLQGFVSSYETGDSAAKSQAIYSAIFANGMYHEITNYASDLNLTLYLQDNSTGSELGFYPGTVGSTGTSTSQASVDSDWIAAGTTGGGVSQAASTSSSAGNASALAATADTQAAHALGVHAHHAG